MSTALVFSVHVCLCLCLLFVTVQSDTSACNHGNDTTCLQMLMSNCDYFWFGEDYHVNCPANLFHTVHCHNPAPAYCSIITRMRMSNDSDTSGIEQVLNVHYGVPEGQYMGCGSRISVPVTDKTIDPVHTIYNDAWALNHRPHVTWMADNNVLYTLAFWDPGWFQLQGLWINIDGGRLGDGEEVLRYRGPMNPLTRKSTVVFLLFRQTGPLNVSDVFAAVERRRTWNGLVNQVHMNQIITDLDLTGPMGASSIQTKVDVYSAHHGRRAGIINNCPYMRTQFTLSQADSLPWDVSNVELSVSVDVFYDSQETSFESCCHQHRIPRRMIAVDSRAPDPLDPVFTRHQPMVVLQQTHIRDDPYYFDHPDRRFTLLLVDVTDATVNDTDNVVVHWQVINIQDARLQTGETILEYMGADVPVMSPERQYGFLLLEQHEELTRQRVEAFRRPNCQPTNRCLFNLQLFMTTLNLKFVGISGFRSTVDPYSRRKMYTDGGRPKSAACLGVSDYSDPCPSERPPVCSGVISLPPVFGLLLGVVVSLYAKF